jgi:hypothetical protein
MEVLLSITRWDHRRESKINRRWKQYEPWCLLQSKQTSTPTETFRMTFHLRINKLLKAQIPWKTVERHNLDDPRLPNEIFEKWLRISLRRKAERTGRVGPANKGKGECIGRIHKNKQPTIERKIIDAI